MTDLWTMAGEEAERDAAEHHLALARIACASYWPVLAHATSKDEYEHAKALISEGVTAAVAVVAASPADQAILASRVLDSFDEDWDAHQAARTAVIDPRSDLRGHMREDHGWGSEILDGQKFSSAYVASMHDHDHYRPQEHGPMNVPHTHEASRTATVEDAPSYGQQMGFGFPAEPLPNEAPELENEIAAWEGTDQQTRVNSGNGIGVSDDSSGPNIAGPGANPGEPPLLHASALDIEAGLEPGTYRLDAFGALIRVVNTRIDEFPHRRHMETQHEGEDWGDGSAEAHKRLHGGSWSNPGQGGYGHPDLAQHEKYPGLANIEDSLGAMFLKGTRHTAPGGGEHAPYYIREEGGKYKVVNRNGEVKGTHDSKESARQQQKALYVNVPGATEEAEKRHGHTPKAVQEEGKKASLQLTALQRQAVQVARHLVDQMPVGVQHHAVAKAMVMRARGFDLDEAETDLVINAALVRTSERLQMQADGVPESKRDRAEKSGDTLPGTDKFPIENKSDLEKAKHDIGRTNEPHDKVVNYINRKADELGGEKVGEDDNSKEASMQKGAPFAGYKNFQDCVHKNQDKDDPEAYCGTIKHQTEGSRLGRLWAKVTGRTAQGNSPAMTPGNMGNPMNPSSVANPFSPAQDVNAAMTDQNPTMGDMAAGAGGVMSPGTQPPDEISGQTVPGSATAATSKPRTKPSDNPNAPKPPPMQQPQGFGPQLLTGMPMAAARARVAVADTILQNNPGMGDDEALHLAAKAIERYPHLVSEAYGGSDYPFDFGDQPAYGACPQCGVQAFDNRSGHCHNCGFVSGTGGPGWDPLSGPTTIRPGRADLRNPGIR